MKKLLILTFTIFGLSGTVFANAQSRAHQQNGDAFNYTHGGGG